MQQASSAVRYARSSVFKATKEANAFEKRAVLRHLADVSVWSCSLKAALDGEAEPRCSHRQCVWQVMQSLRSTSLELSLGMIQLDRILAALVADEWILDCDITTYSPMVLYTVNKTKLLHSRAPIGTETQSTEGVRLLRPASSASTAMLRQATVSVAR